MNAKTQQKISLPLIFISLGIFCQAAEWQWSQPLDENKTRAYLWIPPECEYISAVMLANHNMIEQGILENPIIRNTLAELNIAEIWVVPNLDIRFDPAGNAGQKFQDMLDYFADSSGYQELKTAPIITLGHSANATWPWNFAAWNPKRTLAIISIHGDAPQTKLTGYGGKNPEWGNRNIDGIPGLMVMAEYEWWEDRLNPMFEFKQKYPKAVLAFLADAGQGHFNASSELISFLAMFIKKAAKTRLPSDLQINKTIELINIDPKEGWLIDRWREDKKPIAPPAPYAEFKGDMKEAFWCFDKEMADMTEAYYEKTRGKLPQLLTINGKSGEPLIFTPQLLPDGVSFKIQTGFSDYVPKGHPVIWTKLPEGSKIDHADTGDISLHWIVGPAIQSATDTFRIQFSRAEYVPDRRNNDIWIYANHPGDKKYKSMVQQALFKVLPNKEGQEQTITFPEINNQKVGTKSIKLNATSTSGLPVQYYVLEGPAEIEGNTLKFTKIPPRSKLPIKVTIVAWQWGRGIEPKIKTAQNVTRSFLIEY